MKTLATITIVGALLIAGCSSEPDGSTGSAETAHHRYRCDLQPTEGNAVAGWVTFETMSNHVHVKAEVTGLSPGKHGFHIHEKGDCSAPDGTSAGGHFNPEGMDHAGPDAPKRHHGDLGNLEADATGVAHYERMDFTLQLDGPNSILGKGVIVHANEDDLATQPTGAAGARLACGVIQKAE